MYSTHTLRFLATGEPSSPISGSAFLRPRLAGVLGADPSAAFLPRPRLGVGFCPCRPMSAQLHDEGWWVCGACAPRVRSLRLRRRHSSPSWRARAWAWWRAWAWALAPSRRPSSLLSVQRLPQGRRRAGGERDGHRPSSIFPLRFHDWRGAPAPVSRIPAGGGGGKSAKGGGGATNNNLRQRRIRRFVPVDVDIDIRLRGAVGSARSLRHGGGGFLCACCDSDGCGCYHDDGVVVGDVRHGLLRAGWNWCC